MSVLAALVRRICGAKFIPRQKRASQRFSGIEALEHRILPAFVSIVSEPQGTTSGVGQFNVEQSVDDGQLYWKQKATIAVPDGTPLGTYGIQGSYQETGDLVIKVEPSPGDVFGSPVKVTIKLQGRVEWGLDPIGAAGEDNSTNDFELWGGLTSATDMIHMEGGHHSGPIQWGESTVWTVANMKTIETTVGATFAVHVHQEGTSDLWFSFLPFVEGLHVRSGGEIHSQLEVHVYDVETLLGKLDVGTDNDDLSDELIFGPYLAGANLETEFEVGSDLFDSSVIKTVEWTVDGVTRLANGSDNNWSFRLNVGHLSAGDHALKLIAYDAESRPVAFSKDLTIRVINQLNFELQVQPKAGTLVNDDDARFFQGIAANLTFEGTVSNLPTYYRHFSQLKVGAQLVEVFPSGEFDKQVFRFRFQHDVSNLPLGTTNVDFRVGAISVTNYGDQLEHLLSVEKPSWLAAGNPSFNTTAGEYQWTQANLGLLKVEAPQLKTGEKWLDDNFKKSKKVKSAATLEAFLNVKAPISLEQDPHYDGTRLVGKVTLFGKTVWNKTYTAGDVKVGGSLDARTLDPTSFGVSLANPITVDQFTLTDAHSIKVNLLKGRLPEWLASLTLGGSVSPTVGTVRVNGGIMLTKSGGQVRLDPTGTFLGLDNSTITGQGEVSLTLKVGKGYILEAGAQADLTPEIRIDLNAHFSGVLGDIPMISAVNFMVSAKLKYHASAFARSKLTDEEVHWDSSDDGDADDVLGPYNLIDYHG